MHRLFSLLTIVAVVHVSRTSEGFCGKANVFLVIFRGHLTWRRPSLRRIFQLLDPPHGRPFCLLFGGMAERALVFCFRCSATQQYSMFVFVVGRPVSRERGLAYVNTRASTCCVILVSYYVSSRFAAWSREYTRLPSLFPMYMCIGRGICIFVVGVVSVLFLMPVHIFSYE